MVVREVLTQAARQRSSARVGEVAVLSSGVLMAAYLLLRPYGDTRGVAATAEAFASPWWLIAHLCGVGALACFAAFAWSVAGADRLGAVVRGSAVAGAVLVLPYYGAESFGLHAIGQAYLEGDLVDLELADAVRNHAAAMSSFGIGLLLLAVAGVTSAVAVARSFQPGAAVATRYAAWPLGLLVAVFLPQFYLPPFGRMAFGVAYLAAAIWAWRAQTKWQLAPANRELAAA
ncbi:hypothetical protein ACLM5J_04175 [Nocardioides sp. Bht2]|uniref:hypothetical protein n=1 Tax=Nocardioides sp. Bht2 TaxID=3392297 RepID=UPI0039B6421B